MTKTARVLLFCVVCFAAIASCHAQQPPALTASSAVDGYLRQQFSAIGKNYARLAQAIPAEKYAWRPGEGVRSVSEVLLHVAGANYNFPAMLGVPRPAGIEMKGFEQSATDKDKVIAILEASFKHAVESLDKIGEEQRMKPMKLFGGDTVGLVALLVLNHHMHEHMGQLIAYARTNGVVPPWTEDRQRQQQQRPPQR